jgi:hypothetical protein
MGYRLEISEINYKACGGKLFGYFGNTKDELEELKSYRWLLEKEYISGDEYWSYGCNPQIVLNDDEFREFIKLYNDDWNECYKGQISKDIINDEDIQELMGTNKDKLLEWF